MPSEVRHVFFTASEIKWALVKYLSLKKTPIRFEDILAIKIAEKPEIGVGLKVENASYDVPKWMKFSKADVAGALLVYCRDKKIPIPRKSLKILNVDEGQLFMTMVYDENLDLIKNGMKMVPNALKKLVPA